MQDVFKFDSPAFLPSSWFFLDMNSTNLTQIAMSSLFAPLRLCVSLF
jgi:hypothetical protein